jgi:hypothetical protein
VTHQRVGHNTTTCRCGASTAHLKETLTIPSCPLTLCMPAVLHPGLFGKNKVCVGGNCDSGTSNKTWQRNKCVFIVRSGASRINNSWVIIMPNSCDIFVDDIHAYNARCVCMHSTQDVLFTGIGGANFMRSLK